MNILELRKLISGCQKFSGAKTMKHSPVCNGGFPGTFNLSFTESDLIKEFHGQYLDYDHDFVYSKIQPCIRHQDWDIIKSDEKNRYRYLSVFDMADIGGAVCLVNGDKLDEIAEFSAENLYSFLVKQLGFSPDKFRIKYCRGGSITSLTKGKYPLDTVLPADPKIELWRKLGIHDNQFIPDNTRDTLLALHIYNLPTPWGYRNEIFYDYQGKLLDIATFEYLFLRPIFDVDGKIRDLHQWEHCFVISAIGIERILMVLNGHKTVMECDHIKPLTELVLRDAHKESHVDAIILVEGLRAIHRIVADAGEYRNLSTHRKQKIRDYYTGLLDAMHQLGIQIDSVTIERYVRRNAELQPYYPELTQAVDATVAEIIAAESRFKEGRSKKFKN